MSIAARLAPLVIALALAVTLTTALSVVLGAAHGPAVVVLFRSIAALTVLTVVLMWAVAQWRFISSRAFVAAAAAFGGPEWVRAEEIMAGVAARSTDARVLAELDAMVRAVAG